MTPKHKLLHLEDDTSYIESFCRNFGNDFSIESFTRSSEIPWQHIDSYSGIVVDLNLQESATGYDVIEKIFAKGRPNVFVLTKDNSPSTRVRSLKLGITDFLWKDMPHEEMLLRIRNGLSRVQITTLEYQGLKLDTRTQTAQLDGVRVDITRIEFGILAAMLKSPERSHSRSELVQTVWNGRQIGDGALSSHIYNINRKIEDWSLRLRIVKGEGLLLVSSKDHR